MIRWMMQIESSPNEAPFRLGQKFVGNMTHPTGSDHGGRNLV